MLEEDYAPPARALARRGLSNSIRGFSMDENPGEIVAAVAEGKVDLAIVWGPLAGYYAARYGKTLRLDAIEPASDPPMPFTYAIGAGVRKDAPQLYAQLNTAVAKEREPIQQILRSYHVPLLPLAAEQNVEGGE
jgi:mxaJ protein